MPNTTKGYPYPEDTDAADVPADVQLLAEAVDAAPGIASLTQAQIDALSAGEKWAGRVVWNQTSNKLQRSNGSTFADMPTTADVAVLSNDTPASTGTATAGTGATAARSDHVHAIGASPALTGTPTAPTAAADTNTTQIATTAFVVGQAGTSNPPMDGTATPGTSLRYARQDHVHATDTSRAPLASPALTGTPTAPTAAAGTNTTQIATTAFVNAEITNDRPFEATAGNIAMNGAQSAGSLGTVARGDHVHPTDTSRAPLASPALTGTPTAPTAAAGTNTTQIATTAFVTAADAAKADYEMTANAQSGTTYTFALADARRLTTATNASAKTFTIPPQSSVVWATSSIIRVVNYGAGALTIAGGSGVTVTNASKTLAQYESAALIRTGSDAWTLVPFSGGAGSADFSNTATGTYSSGGFNYKYVTFNASSTLTVSQAGVADVLVVSGGCGGGCDRAGGGGGGSVCSYQSIYLPAGSYSVVIGAGGAGSTVSSSQGSQGGISYLASIISAYPGSGGGSPNAAGGVVGGSGGSPGYNNYGANHQNGGAGGAGCTSNPQNGTAGSNGPTVTNLTNGSTIAYGGGGGGGGWPGTSQAAGGSGGGGAGGTNDTDNAVAGTANTGGGGGGGANGSRPGKNGGSGLIVIRVRT